MSILNSEAWIMHIRRSIKTLHLINTTRRLKEAQDQCNKIFWKHSLKTSFGTYCYQILTDSLITVLQDFLSLFVFIACI